jgi:hypothetical protein
MPTFAQDPKTQSIIVTLKIVFSVMDIKCQLQY